MKKKLETLDTVTLDAAQGGSLYSTVFRGVTAFGESFGAGGKGFFPSVGDGIVAAHKDAMGIKPPTLRYGTKKKDGPIRPSPELLDRIQSRSQGGS